MVLPQYWWVEMLEPGKALLLHKFSVWDQAGTAMPAQAGDSTRFHTTTSQYMTR